MGGNDVARLGFWSAVLVTIWVVIFGLFMVLGLFGIATGPFSYLVCLLLAPSFVVMMTSIHYQTPVAKRIWSQLGLSWAVIYAVLVAITYYVQLTAVRGAADDALRLRPGNRLLCGRHARIRLYVPVHLVRSPGFWDG